MKYTEKELTDLEKRITKRVLDSLKGWPPQKEPQLIAICQDSNFHASLHQGYIITLGQGFDLLSIKDKLIVVKATIHTHFQIMQGRTTKELIMYYELWDNSGCYRSFDIEGNLILDNSQNKLYLIP